MCIAPADVNYHRALRHAHRSMFQMATCLRHTVACVMSSELIKKQGQGQRPQGGVSHPLTWRINIPCHSGEVNGRNTLFHHKVHLDLV